MSAGDVNALAKTDEKEGLQPRLRAAEKLLADARAYASVFFDQMQPGGLEQGGFKQGIRSNLAVKLFTKLDVWVGRYLVSKQDDNAIVFGSLRHIAEHWVGQFCASVPGATPDHFLASVLTQAGETDLVNGSEGTPMQAPSKASSKANKGGASGKSKEVNLGLYEINSKGEITSALGRLLQAVFFRWARPSLSGATGTRCGLFMKLLETM